MTELTEKRNKKKAQKGMIRPFVNKKVRKGKISYELSYYGYNIRVSNEIKIYKKENSVIINQKELKKKKKGVRSSI